MHHRVAILTTDRLPEKLGVEPGKSEDLFCDEETLANSFRMRGIDAQLLDWKSWLSIDWQKFHIVLVRGTWDYIDDPVGFLRALSYISNKSHLINNISAITWNIRKDYLVEMERIGIPIIPSKVIKYSKTFLRDIKDAASDLSNSAHSDDFILKPSLGSGALGLLKRPFNEDFNNAQWKLDPDVYKFGAIVQEYFPGIVDGGEYSIIFIKSQMVGAIRKKPTEGDFRVQSVHGGSYERVFLSKEDQWTAKRAAEAVPVDYHFGRFDFIRGSNGRLHLIEIELIEPQLFVQRLDISEAISSSII